MKSTLSALVLAFAIVSGARSDEAAMPAVFAEPQSNVRVAGHLRVAERLRRDERIVIGEDGAPIVEPIRASSSLGCRGG